jgi:16S rRNA (guanine527-N7)-methyltransferase
VNGTEAGLREGLEAAQALGFVGPGPVEAHIQHSNGFAVVAERGLGRSPAQLVDLGSGGGVPGIVLALRWEATEVALVESSTRRAAFLRDAVTALALGSRVVVLEGRAETIARDSVWREGFEVVTARSFAAPAVTAEIAAGLARPGGLVIVSEPPVPDTARWPAAMPDGLGLGPARPSAAAGAHFVVLAKVGPADGRIPRPAGRVAKRPLW